MPKFQISQKNEGQLKPLIERQLDKLIDNVYLQIRAKNERTLTGKLKQMFVDTFVELEDIKSGIPTYADDVIKVLQSQKSRREVKGMLFEKTEAYFKRTFEKQDLTRLNTIIKKYQGKQLSDTKQTLSELSADYSQTIDQFTWISLGCTLLLFASAFFHRHHLSGISYCLLLLTLVALLVGGVTTPMINLEARIKEMSFVLFDQPLTFTDQVIYFQSKSVLDVFWVMISHPDLQMKIVGLLMVLFSVIFPFFKLLGSFLYFFNIKNLAQNKAVRFFLKKSGKWSMTDVLIVAIFMAYIGFNGIIASQFGKLTTTTEDIVLIATNGTALQTGFFLFLGYAVFSLVLTELMGMERNTTNTSAQTIN